MNESSTKGETIQKVIPREMLLHPHYVPPTLTQAHWEPILLISKFSLLWFFYVQTSRNVYFSFLHKGNILAIFFYFCILLSVNDNISWKYFHFSPWRLPSFLLSCALYHSTCRCTKVYSPLLLCDFLIFYYQYFKITNNVPMNQCISTYFIYLEDKIQNKLLVQILNVSFLDIAKFPSKNDCPSLHSDQQCMRASACPQPGQKNVLSHSFVGYNIIK